MGPAPARDLLLHDHRGRQGRNPARDGGGLWRLTFEDIEQPRRGGTIELLLDGSEPPRLNGPDNIDIETSGNLLIQEDPTRTRTSPASSPTTPPPARAACSRALTPIGSAPTART